MTTTTAPERVDGAPVRTCTYNLWVPALVARDRVRALGLWTDAVAAFGMEAATIPVLLVSESSGWWVVGEVAPLEG